MLIDKIENEIMLVSIVFIYIRYKNYVQIDKSEDEVVSEMENSIKICRALLQAINLSRQLKTVAELLKHNDKLIKQKVCALNIITVKNDLTSRYTEMK